MLRQISHLPFLSSMTKAKPLSVTNLPLCSALLTPLLIPAAQATANPGHTVPLPQAVCFCLECSHQSALLTKLLSIP